jgi:hypothetical protein
MTINYISTATVSSGLFQPSYWKFEISYANYVLIQSNPNALNLNYNGTLVNINDNIYPTGTVPPFGNLWTISESAAGGQWYISFIVNFSQYFLGGIANWLNFDGPYTAGVTGITNSITITNQPQSFVPVYNPVPFTFYSPNYAKDGYRYLVTVAKELTGSTNETIGTFKVVPRIDGSGYLDIQKILASFTTVDFDENSFIMDNTPNSYINYNVSFGEEYTANYPYTHLTKNTTPGLFSGYTVLNQSNSSIINPYRAGDQINVVTTPTGATATINGLHQVLQVIDNHTFVIDASYPTTASTLSISGTTNYADNKKQGYTNLTTITGMTAFNGALDWFDYKHWDETKHVVQYNLTADTTDQVWLLTSINNGSAALDKPKPSDNVVYLTPTQNIWVNFYTMSPNATHYVNFKHSNNNGIIADITITLDDSGPYGPMKQFRVCWLDLGITPKEGDKLSFRIINQSGDPFTRTYDVLADVRCAIEDYEVAFMDRMGSILSIPFYLRATEKINITKETNKQQQYYYDNIDLNLANRGTNVNNVNVVRTYELNTNWMNDGMLALYEEMMSSPYTWLRMKAFSQYDGEYTSNYYACTIDDKDYEVTKQKNKRLIKKTVTIKLANDRPINC